ncbi:DUF2399 domain-containing protein [bacterium]|nr:DUF2399 domain-containing protein [bacterium]
MNSSANYEKLFLDCLLDKYERSRSFSGDNARNQRFSLEPAKVVPQYADDADYDTYTAINQTVQDLECAGLAEADRLKSGVVRRVYLNLYQLDLAYRRVGRIPKRQKQLQAQDLLLPYSQRGDIVGRYCADQLQRLQQNKKLRHCDSAEELTNLLKVLGAIEGVEQETYERDFSVRVLGDSKAFGAMKAKTIAILMEYGDYPDGEAPDRETILEELNIVRNPGHVFFKGGGILDISGQRLDCRQLSGDIGVSSALLDGIGSIEITASRVMTIENLTTFNAFSDDDCFAIYLGGYHNAVRRRFIQRIYAQNGQKQFWHYGDIDAGGLYILLHLRRKTGIDFRPYKMDIATLSGNLALAKPLSSSDAQRLRRLGGDYPEFAALTGYMLEHNCKLEQEALD